jgi:hypothetical protein
MQDTTTNDQIWKGKHMHIWVDYQFYKHFMYTKSTTLVQENIHCITLKCTVKLLFTCESPLNMAIMGSPCLQLCTVWCLQMNFTHWTYFSFYHLIYQEDKHKTCESFIDLGITKNIQKTLIVIKNGLHLHVLCLQFELD